MQDPSYSLSTDDRPLHVSTVQDATNVKQEFLSGSCVSFQHANSPKTVTGHQGIETTRPDQEEHKTEEIQDRKRILFLEAKLTREIDSSKRLKATLEKRKEMLQEKEAELTSIKNFMHSLEEDMRELWAINKRQSIEIQQTGAELRHVKTKYQQTAQLLRERSEEHSTAQQFLGKPDSISPAEVVRLVEALNAEIVHQSNFILDSLTYQKWTGSANDLEHSLEGLRDLLGPWLYNHLFHRLNDPDLEFDHLLTQLALQTGLTNVCKSIINHWYPIWDKGKILDHIHGDMGRKVGQVVAGRWRALSSTHLGVDRKANKQYLMEIILKLIAAVGGSHESGDSFPLDLRDIVDDITRKVLEIREHVKSSLTSMDLEAYSVPCSTQFDASQMEDSDGPSEGTGKDENDNWDDQVICTLEMGLRYKKKVSSGKQGDFIDETGVILKSKVVVASALAN